MKKLLITIILYSFAILNILADTFPLYAYATEIAGFPIQPYADTKNLMIPNDPDIPFEFNGQRWVFESEGENENITIMSSTSTNQTIIIDSSEYLAPNVLGLTYILANIKYYYVDDPTLANALRAQLSAGDISGGDDIKCGNNYSDSNSKSDSNHYQSMYDRWARQAEHAYNSLTNASVSSSTYISNKRLLRDAQREMRETRRKASSAGITITKSEWENAQVKLK